MSLKRNFVVVSLLFYAFGGSLAFADNVNNNNVVVNNENGKKIKNSERAWRFPVGIFVGSTGVGVKVGFEYKYIGIYGVFSTFGTKHLGMQDGFNIRYQTETALYVNDNGRIAQISSGSIMARIKMADYGVDFRIKPFNGAFHIDVGCHYMDYSLTATSSTGSNGSSLEFGGITVDNVNLQQDIILRIAKGFKPYFGLGWDWRVAAQFYITLDFGIMYTGKWQIDMPDIDFGGAESALANTLKSKIGSSLEEGTYGDMRNKIANDTEIGGIEMDKYIKTAYNNGSLKIDGLINDDGSINTEAIMSANDMAGVIANGLVNEQKGEYQAAKEDALKSVDKYNMIPIWPVIKLGFVYKF